MIHVEQSNKADFLVPKIHFTKVKDFSVTGEDFDLFYNDDKSILITSPQPGEDEMDRYYESENYISHTDGKKSWFEKAYQAVKYFSLKRKLNLSNQLRSNKGNILDIGCGTGDFLVTAKNNGWTVLGIEPNTKAKEIAIKKGIEVLSDTEELTENQFDLITLWHVLEHLPELESQLIKYHKLLKPNGSLVAAVPNFNCYSAAHYKSFWAAYDVPRHFWHFSQKGIKNLFSKNQFEVVKMLPMKWDAYYVNLLSEKYAHGRMKIFSAFFHAFKCNLVAKRTGEYASLIYCFRKTSNNAI
jgi:2-polyprenyl-3-methyl-5-hydroxy-6-metoxy-1,4-benzoquinol methylase